MSTQPMTNFNDRITEVKANLPAKNSPKVVQEDPALPVHDEWINLHYDFAREFIHCKLRTLRIKTYPNKEKEYPS